MTNMARDFLLTDLTDHITVSGTVISHVISDLRRDSKRSHGALNIGGVILRRRPPSLGGALVELYRQMFDFIV
jgi:hypothetical protein